MSTKFQLLSIEEVEALLLAQEVRVAKAKKPMQDFSVNLTQGVQASQVSSQQ